MELGRRSFIKGSVVAAAGLGATGTIASASEAPAASAEKDATTAAQGASTGWRTAPAPITDDQITETKTADFVVVGAAHAGGAVLRSIAEDSEHTVIGIERQERESFFTMGNDIGHINSQFLRDRGVEDVDVVEMYSDWMRRCLNSAHPDLVMQWLQNSGADIDWYLEPFDPELVSQFTLAYDPRPESLLDECAGFTYVRGTLRVCTADHPDLNMNTLQQSIYDAILACDNAQMDFGMTACQLVKEDDRVTGVIAQNADGAYVKYVANLGVVLAAGDFAANEEMRADLLTHITDCFQEGRSTWSNIMAQDGSGIRMGVWAGGRMEPRPIACMNGDWCRGNYPQAAIWLDTNGERYCNEFFGELPFSGKPMARIPHVDTWAIADANLATNAATTICAHDAYEPSAANAQALADKLQAAIGTGAEGYVAPADNSHPGAPVAAEGEKAPEIFCADDLETLADYMGYDETQKANMLASVEKWNEMCAAGVDTQYGKQAECLFPIDTPPFYALRQNASMVGGLMVTLGGLMTDKHQNVIDEQCAPIPGLYATGNCCGQRFGVGYFTQTPGNSLGVAITLGRELGKYLAAM